MKEYLTYHLDIVDDTGKTNYREMTISMDTIHSFDTINDLWKYLNKAKARAIAEVRNMTTGEPARTLTVHAATCKQRTYVVCFKPDRYERTNGTAKVHLPDCNCPKPTPDEVRTGVYLIGFIDAADPEQAIEIVQRENNLCILWDTSQCCIE